VGGVGGVGGGGVRGMGGRGRGQGWDYSWFMTAFECLSVDSHSLAL